MMQSERSVAEIAADAIMALETLLYELEDDRLHAAAGPSYAYLAVAASNKWSLDAYDELQAWASGIGRSERPGRWLLMEIGCLECQEPSRVVATFPTEADAEAARREVAAESSTLTQYGVFDLCVEDAQWPE